MRSESSEMSKKKRRQSGRLFPVLLLCFLSVALLVLMISRASGLKASETAAIEPAPGHTSAPGTAVPGPGSSPAGNASPALAQAEVTPEPAPTPVPEPEYFTISMVGDCTLAEAKTRRGWTSYFQDVVKQNYAYPFANTRSWLEDDYLTIANLECCLSDKYRGYSSAYAVYVAVTGVNNSVVEQQPALIGLDRSCTTAYFQAFPPVIGASHDMAVASPELHVGAF